MHRREVLARCTRSTRGAANERYRCIGDYFFYYVGMIPNSSQPSSKLKHNARPTKGSRSRMVTVLALVALAIYFSSNSLQRPGIPLGQIYLFGRRHREYKSVSIFFCSSSPTWQHWRANTLALAADPELIGIVPRHAPCNGKHAQSKLINGKEKMCWKIGHSTRLCFFIQSNINCAI